MRELLEKIVPKHRQPDPRKRDELGDLSLSSSNDAGTSSDTETALDYSTYMTRPFGGFGQDPLKRLKHDGAPPPRLKRKGEQSSTDKYFSASQQLDTQELLKAILELRAQQPAPVPPQPTNSNILMLALVGTSALALAATLAALVI